MRANFWSEQFGATGFVIVPCSPCVCGRAAEVQPRADARVVGHAVLSMLSRHDATCGGRRSLLLLFRSDLSRASYYCTMVGGVCTAVSVHRVLEPSHDSDRAESSCAPNMMSSISPPKHDLEGTRPRNPAKRLCPSPKAKHTRKMIIIRVTVSCSLEELNWPGMLFYKKCHP